MRKLTGAVFISLDGVMQAPGGPDEDPTERLPLRRLDASLLGPDDRAPFGEIISAEYDLLLGKRTYDIFAAYWPEQPGQPDRREIPAHQQICADSFGLSRWTGTTATNCRATRPPRSPS